MEGILNVPDKEIGFILDNLTIDQFTPVNEVTHPDYPNMVLHEPGGKAITLVTSNMPPDLKDEISIIIKKYCNH